MHTQHNITNIKKYRLNVYFPALFLKEPDVFLSFSAPVALSRVPHSPAPSCLLHPYQPTFTSAPR